MSTGQLKAFSYFYQIYDRCWCYVPTFCCQLTIVNRLSHTMPVLSSNPINQRTNPWNFREKILRMGGAGKWVFFSRPFLICFFKKMICFCFFPMKITLAFIWGIIFFCNMDGFFRIFGKDFIRTNINQRYSQWSVSFYRIYRFYV